MFWSTSLFGCDVACDVRARYVEQLRGGLSGPAATKHVLAAFARELADPLAGPVIWMALAFTQWEYGRLEPRVKAKALAAIRTGGGGKVWNAREQRSRDRVLERVRMKLSSPQPAQRTVRRAAVPDHPWTAGQIVAYRRDSGELALLLTEGFRAEPHIGDIPYFVVLDWQGTTLPAAARIARLRPTLTILGMWPNKRPPAIPWERIERLPIYRPLTHLIKISRRGVGVHPFSTPRWNQIEKALDPTLHTTRGW